MGDRLQIDYSRLPARMRDPAKGYIEQGQSPGPFLEAVLADSLTRAWGRADPRNRERMQDWVHFLYNDIPASSWGSQETVNEWIRQGGLEGRRSD